jgi:hypothetical protein
MSEPLIVKVSLDPADVDALAIVMANMSPTDESGKLRSITMPDAIREAIRHAAKKGGRR